MSVKIKRSVYADMFGPTTEELDDLADYSGWATQVVAGCRGGNAWLDEKFDDAVKAAKALL